MADAKRLTGQLLIKRYVKLQLLKRKRDLLPPDLGYDPHFGLFAPRMTGGEHHAYLQANISCYHVIFAIPFRI